MVENVSSTGFYQSMIKNSFADRVNFIIFYLTKGLQLKTSEDGQDLTDELPDSPESFTEFEDLVEPENFSQDLLEWTQDEFEMEDTDVARLLTHNVVCLDNGRCIRANDVGSNCCIF